MGAGITVMCLTVDRKLSILNAGRRPAVVTEVSCFFFNPVTNVGMLVQSTLWSLPATSFPVHFF
jgi:hypothetical protein